MQTVDRTGVVLGTVLHPKGNIAVEIVRAGLARVADRKESLQALPRWVRYIILSYHIISVVLFTYKSRNISHIIYILNFSSILYHFVAANAAKPSWIIAFDSW